MEKFYLHGHFNNSSSMFYKDLILSVGGYNEQLLTFEDYDFWLRVSGKVNFRIVPEILHYVRIRKNSLSQNYSEDSKRLIYNIQKPFFNQFAQIAWQSNPAQEKNMFGWREFFYGSKKLARKYWISAGVKVWNLKLLISFLLTFLPIKYIDRLKDKRLRLRINYNIDRLISGSKVQMEFNRIIKLIDE